MAKYIDMETLLERAKYDNNYRLIIPVEAIKAATAADVAPVVYGRWEFLGPNRLIKECMCGTCSVCKVRSKYIVNTMLCPNCGAKIDGGADHAAD